MDGVLSKGQQSLGSLKHLSQHQLDEISKASDSEGEHEKVGVHGQSKLLAFDEGNPSAKKDANSLVD